MQVCGDSHLAFLHQQKGYSHPTNPVIDKMNRKEKKRYRGGLNQEYRILEVQFIAAKIC